MFKKFILILLTTLLVACGQEVSDDQTKNLSENSEEQTEEADAAVSQGQSESEEQSEPAVAEKSEENKQPLNKLKVHYIDVGQADATLLQYTDEDNNYSILFDTGDWRGSEVVNYLEAQQVTDIDLVVVSHPDADHIGQLADVIHTFNVGEVWLSGNESSSETFQEAIEAVLASDADYYEPKTGEEFEIGPMEIDVLYPSEITGNTNEESITLKFTYGDVRFLFTGDAGKSQELEMIGAGDVGADILQLGHHGSDTSSDPSFIDAVNPSVAIYSAGEENSYGHPSEEVVSLIQNKGIDLYGTDVHGTIVVTTDGKNFNISTKEDGTINPENTASSESKSESQQGTTAEPVNETGGSCININEASEEEVQEIIHIGPERAGDLVELRPYGTVGDLDRIDGIGPARIADIEEEGLACAGG